MAAVAIDFGRKGFATRGKAEEGRLSYEKGISIAMDTFKDAQSTNDPYTIIGIEYAFLLQELQFCDENDTDNFNSLTQGIKLFDDAFLVLQITKEKTNYHFIDKGIPHHKDHRVNGFPKDSFHIAALSHITRINNNLRSSGIDIIEKYLLRQRKANITTAINAYLEKQRLAMAIYNL